MDTHSQNDLQISLFTFYSKHIIQHSRFARQDGWKLDDISLCSSGNIAVSGHKYQSSFVCVYSTVDNSDSRDKPTLLYDKEFEHKDSVWPPWRRISFMEPNSTEIVTCRYDEVQVIDYNRDVVLRSRKVNGKTMCLFVSESQIFIGLDESDIVNIYDKDLNRIKSIRLKEIRGDDYPWDMTAAADRLYVCTALYDRAIVYSQNSGSVLTEYNTGNNAWSVTVNVQIAVVAVLWSGRSKRQVAVYSFTDNNCLVVFDVESGVARIRISDQGRIVTGYYDTGEVKIYDLPQIFTYNNLKVTLSSLFSKYDLEELVKYFKISDDSLEDGSGGRRDEKKKAARLLSILEEKGFRNDGDFHYLKEAFSHLGSCYTSRFMNLVDFYQQHADKNRANQTQTSDRDESGHKLQLDGLSSDWTACDMSLSSAGMAVESGYSSTTKKTSLDVIWKDDSGSWGLWVKTREPDGGSESECLVSFIDEYRLVTCCGNVVKIINCNTSETDIRVSLQSSGCASCIAVRNQDVYIGFQESSTILVLNRDLQEKGSVTLKEVKNMWPVDLTVTPGKLLVCLKNDTSSQVGLFNEKDGKKLVEYRNIYDETQTPLSVAVSEESDLVGILWSTDIEEYDGEPYGHISLHSLTHGYCLSFVAVAFTFQEFECYCYQRNEGCSSGKRVRFLSGHLAVMDDLGGVKFIDMKEVFSEENVTSTLSQVLCFKDCKGFKPALEDDGEDDGSGSECKDSEDRGIQYHEKMGRLDDILAILTTKRHLALESVNNLRRQFSHHDHSHPIGRFPGELTDDQVEMLGFGRCGRNNNVNISFASSHTFAVSVSCSERICSSFIYIYHWDGSSNTQPMLSYYRKFESDPFVSFFDDCKAVICCDDVVEMVTLTSSHAKVAASHKLKSSPSCMATWEGNVYLGFRSSEIMVLNSKLDQTRNIKMHSENCGWPSDLTVTPGRLFVCMGGSLAKAISLNEDGQKVMEYNFITDEACQNVYTVRYEAGSISVSENNDLVGICWHPDEEEEDEEMNCQITLHSLSSGSCLAVVDECSATVLRFNGDKRISTISPNGKVEFFHVGQLFIFQHWKTLLALKMSFNEYEKLCKFYAVSESEIAEKKDGQSGLLEKTVRMKCLLEILTERGVIKPDDVSHMKDANASLYEVYSEKLWQPIQAYIEFSGKSSNHVALSLLDLCNSVGSQDITDNCVTLRTDQTLNLAQLNPGQLSSPETPISLQPGPSNVPPLVSGKRLLNESHHLNGHGQFTGKRIRFTAADSRQIPQAPVASTPLEVLTGLISVVPSTAPTPVESLRPVPGSSVLQELMPVSTEVSSSRVGLVPDFSSRMPALLGNQTRSQNMLLQPSQPITVSLLPQPLSSEVTQPRNLTELHPPNEFGQNGQSQAGNQVSYPIALQNAQQDFVPGISQTHQSIGQGTSICTPSALPQSRHSIPAQYGQSMPPQLRHSVSTPLRQLSPPQVSQGLSLFRHNMPQQIRHSMPAQFRQSMPPQLRQSMSAQLRQPMPLQLRHPMPPQVRHSLPTQVGHSIPSLGRYPSQPQCRPSVSPQVGQSTQQQRLQDMRQSTRPHMLQEMQNEHRDTLQRQQPSAHLTQPQTISSVEPQPANMIQSYGPPIVQPVAALTEQNTQQGKSTSELQNVQRYEGITGQQALLRQMDRTIARESTEHGVHMTDNTVSNTQQNTEQAAQLPLPHNVSHLDISDRECHTVHQGSMTTEAGTPQEGSSTRPETNQAASHSVSEDMMAAAESPFQKFQAILLKDIHERVVNMNNCSDSPHSLQDTPGTSSVSRSKDVSSRSDSEREQEAMRYLNSLSQETKNTFLAFEGETDDREELVRRLVEDIFTGEERGNSNCFGTAGLKQLDGVKLQVIRHVTFYLCPIKTKKHFSDKLEDKIWKRLCGEIDMSNRHYRQELNRQKKRKGRSQKS